MTAFRVLELPCPQEAGSEHEWLRWVQAEMSRVRGVKLSLSELQSLWGLARTMAAAFGDILSVHLGCRCLGSAGVEQCVEPLAVHILRGLLAARYPEELAGRYGVLVEARDYVAG
ncbi:MAG: hypothetical protein ACPLRW_05540, partial [Moorellales bacterium]